MWDAAELKAGTSTEIWIASAETWILPAACPAWTCPWPCPGLVMRAATLRAGHTRARSLSSAAQAEQSRRRMPSRKVRTSQGRVVGNADPGKPAGKCHRKDTA